MKVSKRSQVSKLATGTIGAMGLVLSLLVSHPTFADDLDGASLCAQFSKGYLAQLGTEAKADSNLSTTDLKDGDSKSAERVGHYLAVRDMVRDECIKGFTTQTSPEAGIRAAFEKCVARCGAYLAEKGNMPCTRACSGGRSFATAFTQGFEYAKRGCETATAEKSVTGTSTKAIGEVLRATESINKRAAGDSR